MKFTNLFLSLFIFLAIGTTVYALTPSLTSPVGGRVLATGKLTSAAIKCVAQFGPFFVFPYNLAIPGPFFIRYGTSGPKTGGHILGNYKLVPDMKTCFNPETGAPIPAFEVKPYGVSR